MNRQHYDFTSTETGRPMRAVFEPGARPVVKFYDRSYDFTPDGQYTGASYYASTLTGSTTAAHGLMLHGGEPAWNLSAEDMRGVLDALQAWLDEERTYVVGVPLVVTVDKFGAVRMTLDASEVADRHFGEESEYAETHIDQDRARIAGAILRHTASLTY